MLQPEPRLHPLSQALALIILAALMLDPVWQFSGVLTTPSHVPSGPPLPVQPQEEELGVVWPKDERGPGQPGVGDSCPSPRAVTQAGPKLQTVTSREQGLEGAPHLHCRGETWIYSRGSLTTPPTSASLPLAPWPLQDGPTAPHLWFSGTPVESRPQ